MGGHMITKEFCGITLPALGLGCMRLPTDENRAIRVPEVAEMVAYAMGHGVNYFDTGYDYHEGMSERVLGQVLAAYPRDSYYLADKFPGYAPLNWRKVEAIFEEQLARCGVEYFDFYLFHNVCELNIDAYLSPKYGIMDYLWRQKEAGRIKHLGFSVHGSGETTKRFLAAYGERMEFCQIQLNYIDYEFQQAKEKLALLRQYNIPAWVMEPLRGGKLASLPALYAEKLQAVLPGTRPHEAAFRFVYSMPEVTLTLSGMSNLEQVRDNIGIFSHPAPLSPDGQKALLELAAEMTAVGTVPCTGCRYCTAHCPAGLDIPKLIGYYNEHTFSGGGFIVPSAVAAMPRDKRPNACIACRACEALCPQNIRVADVLADLSDKLHLK